MSITPERRAELDAELVALQREQAALGVHVERLRLAFRDELGVDIPRPVAVPADFLARLESALAGLLAEVRALR